MPLPQLTDLKAPIIVVRTLLSQILKQRGRGGDGQRGAATVRRADGRVEPLSGCDQTVLEPGDAITIVTPTGGGFGTRQQ